MHYFARWWFQILFIFTPIPGEMIQFDLRIFFRWVGEKPQTSFVFGPMIVRMVWPHVTFSDNNTAISFKEGAREG